MPRAVVPRRAFAARWAVRVLVSYGFFIDLQWLLAHGAGPTALSAQGRPLKR